MKLGCNTYNKTFEDGLSLKICIMLLLGNFEQCHNFIFNRVSTDFIKAYSMRIPVQKFQELVKNGLKKQNQFNTKFKVVQKTKPLYAFFVLHTFIFK